VVALRADGGAAVGLGHVRRCLALATAIAPWGDCHLLLRGDRDATAGAAVPVLAVGPVWDDTVTAAVGLGASALVADSYAVTAADLRTARDVMPTVVAIDDTGRFPVPADIVVNAALGPQAPSATDGTVYLLGPRFALLAPDFTGAPRRLVPAEIRRVLVALGGAARADLIALVVRAVRRALPAAAMDVVVGPVGDGLDAARVAVDGTDRVTLRPAPRTLRPLMDTAELAVTAGGVTLLELAAVGVPAVGISLAPNQDGNLGGFAEAGAVGLAGRASDAGLGDRVTVAVRDLADPARRRAMAERARALVDGGGAARVAACLRSTRASSSRRRGPTTTAIS
jgi:spore coat polysaccharide biosynthesis predicted glycosyltransferase SpsG